MLLPYDLLTETNVCGDLAITDSQKTQTANRHADFHKTHVCPSLS